MIAMRRYQGVYVKVLSLIEECERALRRALEEGDDGEFLYNCQYYADSLHFTICRESTEDGREFFHYLLEYGHEIFALQLSEIMLQLFRMIEAVK